LEVKLNEREKKFLDGSHKRGRLMAFPLGLDDILIWFTLTSFILLITSALFGTREGFSGIMIEKSRLRIVTIIIFIIFAFLIFIKIQEIIINR